MRLKRPRTKSITNGCPPSLRQFAETDLNFGALLVASALGIAQLVAAGFFERLGFPLPVMYVIMVVMFVVGVKYVFLALHLRRGH